MVTIRLFIYKLKNSHAYKDENISFHKYINSWTLHRYIGIYQEILMKILIKKIVMIKIDQNS